MDADIFRNPAREEGEYVLVHPDEGGLCIEELGDFLIQASEAAEFSVPVRVGQAAKVEDEIGIGGNAVFEAEGFQQYR